MTTAWSFLTLDAEGRQFNGNLGYDDDPCRHYSWDSTVHKHRGPAPGDLAVVRDGDVVLGIGWIDDVERWVGSKNRYRCPGCSHTGFKARQSKSPRYRCYLCRHEFDEPTAELLEGITFYRADYERTWRELDIRLPVASIEHAYVANAKQHAIRELKLEVIAEVIRGVLHLGAPWWSAGAAQTVDLGGGHRVVVGKARIGQQRFREELLARFGEACAVCGPLPASVLDAAHLYRFAEQPKHEIDGGLLLRRDLHALFDRNLVLIDPDAGWTVDVAPSLAVYPDLWKLRGGVLKVDERLRPNAEYLRSHAALARASWETGA